MRVALRGWDRDHGRQSIVNYQLSITDFKEGADLEITKDQRRVTIARDRTDDVPVVEVWFHVSDVQIGKNSNYFGTASFTKEDAALLFAISYRDAELPEIVQALASASRGIQRRNS